MAQNYTASDLPLVMLETIKAYKTEVGRDNVSLSYDHSIDPSLNGGVYNAGVDLGLLPERPIEVLLNGELPPFLFGSLITQDILRRQADSNKLEAQVEGYKTRELPYVDSRRARSFVTKSIEIVTLNGLRRLIKEDNPHLAEFLTNPSPIENDLIKGAIFSLGGTITYGLLDYQGELDNKIIPVAKYIRLRAD